jgi:NADH-quinone oxidoreductase subunit M
VFFTNHLLSVILFTPLVGALLFLLLPREAQTLHRIFGNLFGVLGFLVSIPLVTRFPVGTDGYSFKETADWIPSIGAKYSLGIDGISLLLIMLTTLLGMIAILSSWSAIKTRTKEYYILLLLLQTGMLGVFMSLDFFLFYVFWEVMLVPMYFLIGVWGSDRRLYAAIKFFLYTLAGSVLMLLAILALYFNYAKTLPPGSVGTFDIPTLLAAAQGFPDALKVWLFWGFFFAFAIKVPMFPFHTWLPDAHTEAPTAGSVILAGVLLKMGTYGFLRFSLPLLPTDAIPRARIIHIVVVLSLIGIIYGAVVCLMQKDMKRLIAYSSVSHLGFCTLGIFALTPLGLAGSVLQQVNHGISTGALFALVGMMYERRHSLEIADYGGVATPAPWLSTVFLITTFASAGLPLLSNFVGEFLVLQGAAQAHFQWAVFAAIGVILAACYLLWLYQRVFYGETPDEVRSHMSDLSAREWSAVIPLLAMMVWLGVGSQTFLPRIGAVTAPILQKTTENVPFQVRVGQVPDPPGAEGAQLGRSGTCPTEPQEIARVR